MARPPSSSRRVLEHPGANHVGRHRRTRLASVDGESSGLDEEASLPPGSGRRDRAPAGHGVDARGGRRDRATVGRGVDAGDGAQSDTSDTSDEELADVARAGDPAATVVPLFSVPDSLRSVDVAVGGRAVRGLLLVAVVLLLTLGGRWWWVNQQAAGVPVEQVVGADGTASSDQQGAEAGERPSGQDGTEGTEGPLDQDAPPGPGASPDSTAGATSTAPGASEPEGRATEAVLMVHVIGQVHEPGVVELPLGSRVIDAVRAAGGVTDEADPASLNLARPVADGEQVWVGAPGEEPPPGLGTGLPHAGTGGAAPGSGAGPPGAAGDQDGPGPVVDLNLAGQAELEELPGIGPVTAGHILAWREQHGRFTVIEELMEVSGIGEKTFEQLRPHVTVGG